MNKYEIAQILREMAIIIEIVDPQPKKGIAYRKAARSIELASDFEDLVNTKKLEILPGIGKKISSHIQILLKEGHLPFHEYLTKQIPRSLLELTHIPGLSTQKIKILYKNLEISSLQDLRKALEEKKLSGIKPFSLSFIKKLETRVQDILLYGNTLLYSQAKLISDALLESLKGYTEKIMAAGELRRFTEIIGNLSFIAVSETAKDCLAHFKQHRFVETVIKESVELITVLLKQGLKATLQIVPMHEFPIELLKATGNQGHLIDLENEFQKQKPGLLYFSEEEIYQSLGLNFIFPELREGYGEVEFAKHNDFSDLIELTDLKGTFHCHTVDSDGQHTIEEMAQAAQQLGWSYLGISDHSKSSYQANGLSEDRLSKQIEYIRSLNKKFSSQFTIFAGIECDLLQDGQLDVSEDLLKQLDFVIISIHRFFKQEREVMTKRLIKAIENPYTTIIGHVSGRLLRIREPYQVDIEKVIDACIANNKIIELNAYPSRLDMDWRYWIKARGKGLKCSINPDAHSIRDLKHCITYGVPFARKGWIKKRDVINTFTRQEMISYLKGRKSD